jgi:hypothetical protein
MTMNRPLLFTLCLVAGVAAQAQVVRLEVDYIDNGGLVPGDTYRVYAVMQNEGDIIDAVFGEASAPLSITSTKPFYQHPEGGPLSADIQRQTAAEKPALAYDSWVTIGSEDNYMNAVSGFIMDFTSFNEGGELATNDGAWFVTPDKRQAMAPPSKRILLMQLTTAGKVNGLINIHGRTKAETDAEGNVVSGQQLIQAEGLVFECYPPR